jgi:protein disulfide-isomerase A1
MEMKNLIVLLICVLALNTIKADEPVVEENVLVLTDKNFDETIAKYPHILVEFYAPWCGHCKKLAPEYSAAAGVLKDEGIPLAKVDTTVEKEVGERFKIQGFPTLKFFTNGKDMEYGGGRTKNDIVNWMRKKTGPATKELKTVSEVEAHTQSNEVAVVLFGAEGLVNYADYAKNYDDISFAHCIAQECLDNWKVENGTVVIFKKFDEGRNDLAKGYNLSAFKDFIDNKTVPTIMKFDEKCAQHVFGKSNPGLFLYYDKNSENAAALEAILKEVAEKVKGHIQVISTGIKEGLETRLAEYIGVTQADLPTVRIADTKTELKKYTMSGDVTSENILKFVDEWRNKKLTASLKSEEIPATQNEPVYVLVGKAFDQVVMDPTKDVLVEFYAPWCGHCKKIAPIYEEVATKLGHNKNLIIAKMDATANETDKVSIQGFPTIKFWPAGNKDKPLDFEGDRTVDGFIDYITKHSTNPLIPKDDL